jgi:hypothetical protein
MVRISLVAAVSCNSSRYQVYEKGPDPLASMLSWVVSPERTVTFWGCRVIVATARPPPSTRVSV